uniref:Beta-microseminoprotein n=1 Tax=Phascolarctos cinereus TaxID=38626 RepID=A0A6P5KY80_PHACI|nr:beta-microseminoprotein-like [Phascolarctos cinereus]
MNTMLVVLLALALFVTFCDAQCTFIPLEIVNGYQPGGCSDGKGTIHSFGTQWQSNCVHCSCEERVGLSCCNIVMRPMGYDKKQCTEVFKQESCIYIPVNKANPSRYCEVKMYVG